MFVTGIDMDKSRYAGRSLSIQRAFQHFTDAGEKPGVVNMPRQTNDQSLQVSVAKGFANGPNVPIANRRSAATAHANIQKDFRKELEVGSEFNRENRKLVNDAAQDVKLFEEKQAEVGIRG